MPIADILPRVPGTLLETPEGMATTPGALGADEPVEPDRPGFFDAVDAHFRIDNLIASMAAGETWHTDNTPDPDFDAWEKIRGTDREQFWEQYVDVGNQARFDAVSRDIDREMEDRKTIAATPLWASLPLTLAAGILDPTILIPGGAFVRGAKGGLSVLRSALNTGIATGAAVAVQEAGLHATQQLRTGTESAVAIGGSVLLGGLLGAGGAKLMSRAEWRGAVDALDRELSVPATAAGAGGRARLEEIYRGVLAKDGIVGEEADRQTAEYLKTVGEPATITDTSIPTAPVGASMGAAAGPRADLDALTIAGRAAGLTAKSTAFLNPGLRLAESPSGVERETAFNLFEMTQYLRGADQGIAAPRAVETLRKEWNAGLMQAVTNTRDGFKAYRQRAGRGGLSRAEFSDAVGKSMRRGDVHEIPEVANAAASWRKQVFDPLKEAAIAAKLLPEDVSAETAVSYFSRVYNRQRLTAEEGLFKRTVGEWVLPQVRESQAAVGRMESTRRERILARRRAAKVDRRIATIEKRLTAGEAQAAERALESRGAGARVEKVEDRAKAVGEDISELEEFIAAMRAEAADPTVKDRITLLEHELRALRAEREETGDITGELAAMDTRGPTTAAIRAKKDAGIALSKIDLRTAEAKIAVTRSKARTKTLDRRAVLNALKRDILKAARENLEKETDRLTLGLESDIRAWGGDSSTEAISALKVRDEAERLRKLRQEAGIYEGSAGRLTAADRAVDRAIRKIVKARADWIDAEVRTYAKEIGDEVFNKLTGRGGDSVRPHAVTIEARGPLKARTFMIPDEMIERWLESDIDFVGRRYQRIMSADVEITKKFGDVQMTDAIKAIREDYAKLRAAAKDEKALAALDKAETNGVRDLMGIRDLIRGTYDLAGWERNFGRIVRVSNMLNYIRSMGQVVLSSLPEAYRTAMVHGMRPFLSTIGKALSNPAAFKMSVKEAKLAGNIAERVLSSRLATLAEIGDFYTSRGTVEKFMANMTEVASSWNGIRLWTDSAKMIAAVATQHRVLQTAGKFAKASAKDKRYLAYLGVGEGMATKIAKQFDEFGETVDDVMVANTERWTDKDAVRAYRAAVNKDIDTQVVTRSVADIPLFANTPMGRVLFQFNTFNLASHQRVLLRGLQEGPGRFAAGAVALTVMGMMVTKLQSIAANREVPDFAENPGWWIAEGLDRGGLFMVPMQVANAMEKFTGLNPIKAPIKAFDEASAQSMRLNNRNAASFLGPTMGLIEDASRVAGIPLTMWAAKDDASKEGITQGQKGAAERLLPFNSYFGMRQMLRYIVNPPQGE